jgi:hypothetical protein
VSGWIAATNHIVATSLAQHANDKDITPKRERSYESATAAAAVGLFTKLL